MPTFTVRYATPDGRQAVRQVNAADARGAAAVVETAGHIPIDVDVRGSGGGRSVSRRTTASPGKRGRKAVVAFAQQLTSVIESGIPLLTGLRVIASQTGHKGLRESIERVADRVEGGSALAEALEPESHFFSEVFVKSVAAGEASGHLAEILDALASYEETDLDNRGRIKSALLYPFLVVGALVLATVIMLWSVIPRFAAMFDRMDAELPLITRALVALSTYTRDYALFIFAGLVLFVFAWRRVFALNGPRRWIDGHKLRIPIFGPLLLSGYMHRLVEMLNLMNRSSLPIIQSLHVTADSMSNRVIRDDVRGLVRSIEGGETLGEAFARSRWITPLIRRMLAVAEHSGRTDRVLEYLGRYYASQTQRTIKTLSTLIEPFLIGGLALIVLLFSFAIFMPMWQMLQLIGST